VALKLTGDPGDVNVSCVTQYVQGDGTLGPAAVFAMPATWSKVFARGTAMIPQADYLVQTDCSSGFSTAVPVTSDDWGDVDDDGDVDSDDIVAILDAFVGFFIETTPQAADLMPCNLNGIIDVDDLTAVLDAFVGVGYSQRCQAPCP
jgi:hypothetical protein